MTINKNILYILIALVSIFFCFWLLFYAKFIANYSLIISLRNSYFTQIDKITPKSWFIYRIRPTKIDEYGEYTYKFPGKFESFNYEESTITLLDLHGKPWTFKYFLNRNIDNPLNGNLDRLLFKETLITEQGKFNSQIYGIEINNPTNAEDDQVFTKDDLIVIYWRDKRNLLEVIKANKNGEQLEMNGADMMQIHKIIWE